MILDRPKIAVTLLAVAAAWSAGASAQQVFRIVGPDGRVTFSDRPPADPATKAQPAPVVPLGNAGPSAGLPFELRNASSRFPVTLYTGNNCNPCNAARSFLATRGIPFTERTITTTDDAEALQRLSGSVSLPVATIGSQQLKGFSEPEWGHFLDAAGYPKTSQLPRGYRNPAPAPLVAVQSPAQQPQEAAAAPAPAPVLPSAPPPSNPAGIQF